MNQLEHLKSNKNIFFNFMKEDYPLFRYSNLFLRDLQYAIKSYFDMKENPISYSQAEIIARNFIDELLKSNDILQIDKKSWKVNFDIGIKHKVSEPEGVSNEQLN
ncbi:MAG: hypothetical protein IPH62_18680 [Ignavibacteriae bacterium]|nr:hypothetical protein [Ignavibacteriota bacterium]